ncbi:MAG: bi-domain-containing oxidoreductase [Armatimonadetes bacterium]|nr:bi-domain-containing oxidoreductase [Armatimonadota bacterium]
MKQILQNYRTGELGVHDVPAPLCQAGGILVQNACSLISAGTERSSVSLARTSLIGKALKRPDLVRKVLEKARRDGIGSTYRSVMERLDQYVPLGYSCSGKVLETGEDESDFRPGDLVACAGAGYANHAEMIYVPWNLAVRVPHGVDLREAAFVTVGAIALQGVRRSEAVLGEWVAVIGLGLLGLITVQLLRAAGCLVAGVDPDPRKLEMARTFGASCVFSADDSLASDEIRARTEGRGVDSCIITAATTSNDPVEKAAEVCRDRGRVVVVGAVRMDLPRPPFYEKELELRLSRSYGPGRYDPAYEAHGIDYPPGYVRWTERRNMESFLQLVADKRINLTSLVTHEFPVEEAKRAYDLVSGESKDWYVGILLSYSRDISDIQERRLSPQISGDRRIVGPDLLRIGLIGTGNFARGTLIPALEKMKDVHIQAVASASGVSAKLVAERLGSGYCTSDYREIVKDPEMSALVAATRHNLHGPLVLEALREKKAIFVEKPLCISMGELTAIVREFDKGLEDGPGRVMVGFNRRFARQTIAVRDHFKDRKSPLQMLYRVNAGHIPPDHWVHDPVQGGGRIVGEVCHFVDWMQFVSGAPPVRVFARDAKGAAPLPDNLCAVLEFADGSCGTILYSASGSSAIPKEHVEVYGEGSTAVIHDFRKTVILSGRRARTSTGGGKGHAEELAAFVRWARLGGDAPIPWRELVWTTAAVFAILESLKAGEAREVRIPGWEKGGNSACDAE